VHRHFVSQSASVTSEIGRYLATSNDKRGDFSLVSDVQLFGQLEKWPSMMEMTRLMRAAGFDVFVGRYSIRLKDCEHFVFQEYGGDLGSPQIDADASTLDRMLEDGGRVSAVLAAVDIRHRFEIYNETDELVGYLHHRWPQVGLDSGA
jgi:hypothetical protein